MRDFSDRPNKQLPQRLPEVPIRQHCPRRPSGYISLYAIHTMGLSVWKVEVGWRTDGCVFMSSIWMRTTIVVRDMSDRPNEQVPNDYRKFRYENTAPTGREGECISLYTIHRMEDGGWKAVIGWRTNACVYVFIIGANKRSRCATLVID